MLRRLFSSLSRPRLVLWGGSDKDWTVGREPTLTTSTSWVPRGVQWVSVCGLGERWMYVR